MTHTKHHEILAIWRLRRPAWRPAARPGSLTLAAPFSVGCPTAHAQHDGKPVCAARQVQRSLHTHSTIRPTGRQPSPPPSTSPTSPSMKHAATSTLAFTTTSPAHAGTRHTYAHIRTHMLTVCSCTTSSRRSTRRGGWQPGAAPPWSSTSPTSWSAWTSRCGWAVSRACSITTGAASRVQVYRRQLRSQPVAAGLPDHVPRHHPSRRSTSGRHCRY